MADEGLIKAVDFKLDQLLLVSTNGRSTDLRLIMRELNIYEDLFCNTMSGDLVLQDTQDLTNEIPIVGNEWLIVDFKKPSTLFQFRKVFRIYKVSNRKRSGTYVEDYVLHFTSEETLLNESVKISKSYKGLPVSEMIRDIATRYLGISAARFPDSALATTTDKYDVVIPLWQPFYTINWLSRLGRPSSSRSFSCVFYEDADGFHFQSLEVLAQQDPLRSLIYTPANVIKERSKKETDIDIRLRAIEQYEVPEGPDILRTVSLGGYANKLVTVNPLDQRVNTVSMNAQTLFDSTKHLNKLSLLIPSVNRLGVRQTDQYESHLRVMADSLNVGQWLLPRTAYLEGLNLFRVKLSVPGHLDLHVGKTIRLDIPAAQVPVTFTDRVDELYSGKYLITAVRHKIDRVAYACIVELSKDSIAHSIPGPKESDPAITKLKAS